MHCSGHVAAAFVIGKSNDVLLANGCDPGQGYHLPRPMADHEVRDLFGPGEAILPA
jgi:hypothetical protein